ncbi:MAG: family 1 encapsulin nanocompartment shell protein [Arachnia sp.]
MNNLHRSLAPISDAAWADIEEEAKRTFERNIAARRVVDVAGPHGNDFAAVGLGRLHQVDSPEDGVRARVFRSKPVVQLRVPFSLSREEIDGVERGSKDADWVPLKEAARRIAFAEDRAILDGYAAGGIDGIRPASSNLPIRVPTDATDVPEAISQAVSELRLAGVEGPYSVLLGAELYTLVSETSDHGFPIVNHLTRIVDGDIIWAPAIEGAVVMTTRGGDYELHLGQDLSIGYLSHDAESVELYFQESFAFLTNTTEASVTLTPSP